MTFSTQGAAALPPPSDNMKHRTVTERKIGKVTYLVVASSSDTAVDYVERKIEKLIIRDSGRILR